MIERLVGVCVAKSPSGVVLDVSGVGYGVEMTDAALAGIEVGSGPFVVWVHTHVREDILRLYGFVAAADRALFAVLISLTGIGPKLAMAILSRLSATDLAQAVELDDSTPLEDVPGIGGPRAKKILLELKPKIQKVLTTTALTRVAAATPGSSPVDLFAKGSKGLSKATLADLASTLENFGYKEKEVAPIVRRFAAQPPSQDLSELVRLALAELSGARRAEGARADNMKDIF